MRHLNFAILRKLCILAHFIFVFLSETHFISLSMLFNMSLIFFVEAIGRFKQLVEQQYKDLVNGQLEDCTKEVLSGVETESSSDEEDRPEHYHRIAQNNCYKRV